MTDHPAQPGNPKDSNNSSGVPAWMPLVGLLSAFVVALVIGATICPTLSALVFPPGPKLPTAGPVHEISHESKGTGLDEWLYTTDLSGCGVAQFYADWLKNCVYDPSVSCHQGEDGNVIISPGQSYAVVQCTGTQSIGTYHLAWTVYVTSGISEGDRTAFRLIREVAS